MKFKLIMVLSILGLLIMWFVSFNDKQAKIIFCDVGQGDGIIFKKFNQEIVVDVGPDNKKMLSCLGRHLAFWDKKIEILILSHGDSDHVGGLENVIKSYRVDYIFSNEGLEVLNEHNIYTKNLSQGDTLKTSLINFEVVNPEKINNFTDDNNENSIAGILSYKDKSIFLSGDISQSVEQRLVWQKVIKEPVDILKVSHHGSESGTSDEILEILKPKAAVISVGKNNKFGHPRSEVLESLKKKDILVKRTDEVEDILIC